MIADAAKHQFSVVIVWKLDRFARNRYDSAMYKARLKKHGVRVISAKESLTDTPEGIILEGMLESMAEYYSANLSVNVKRGQRETIAKGKFCGGTIPYGYKIVDGKLIPDEKTAPVIRYIFEEYAKGTPKKQIMEALTRRGVKSPTGKPLGISSFQRALRNTVYYGEFVFKGKVVEGCATPIISKDLFDEVQAKLSITAHAPSSNKAQVEYLLRGKAFCGHCGAPMVGESGRGKSGSVFNYYACATKKKHHTCKKKNERKENIESWVVWNTVNYVLNPVNLDDISRAVVAEYNREFSSSKINDMERELKRLERELNNLVDTLAEAPKVTHKRIYEKMEALENQRVDLEEDLIKQRIACGIHYTEDEVKAWIKNFCEGDIGDEAYRRKIIDLLVNTVYLYDDFGVIFYNFPGGKVKVSYGDMLLALQNDSADAPECSDLEGSLPLRKKASRQGRLFRAGAGGVRDWRHEISKAT